MLCRDAVLRGGLAPRETPPCTATKIAISLPSRTDLPRCHRGAGLTCRYSSGYETANAPATVSTLVEKVEELLLPLPPQEGAADDPQIHNPLLRHQRLSTSWFGVICEWDGVVVQGSDEETVKAWLQTASELGFQRPLGQQLRRIKGVRDEVVVSRVFGWTHNPTMCRQVAQHKSRVLEQLLEGRSPTAMLEAKPFLELLKRNSIPIALATPLPEAKVQEGLRRLQLASYFDAVVTADDSGSAELEFYYALAAQQLGRPPLRCLVVGESNSSVEAAHELGMKSIVVTGTQPVYDFTAADLVVRNLSQLSFHNCRKLFGNEGPVEPRAGAAGEGERLADGPLRAEFDEGDDDFVLGGIARDDEQQGAFARTWY